MVFTAWPPVILGIFEKDISEASIHAHPSTYRHTQQVHFRHATMQYLTLSHHRYCLLLQ